MLRGCKGLPIDDGTEREDDLGVDQHGYRAEEDRLYRYVQGLGFGLGSGFGFGFGLGFGLGSGSGFGSGFGFGLRVRAEGSG